VQCTGEDVRHESTNPQNIEKGMGGVKKSRKVAVIGCGAAGLVAARELVREGHRVSVFEQRDTVGGQWVYDPEIETDLLGICANRQRVHSSMYASLRTNVPRELMGFLDYSFIPNENEKDEQEQKEGSPKRDTRRYPGHAEVGSYLQAFAEHFGLMEYIHFSTVVEYAGVCEIGENNEISWKVRTRRVGGKTPPTTSLEEDFDAVVVCNGHYFEPYVAPIPGRLICSTLLLSKDGWILFSLHPLLIQYEIMQLVQDDQEIQIMP
jgi:cation diffusion facilitator CzcD-associated flavoprotein CzcO